MAKRRRKPTPIIVRDGLGTIVHPGEWLFEAFMREYSVTQNALARAMGISARRVNEIVKGQRRITGETALLLEDATGISAPHWMALQAEYELALARQVMANAPPRKTVPLRELRESDEYFPDWLAAYSLNGP